MPHLILQQLSEWGNGAIKFSDKQEFRLYCPHREGLGWTKATRYMTLETAHLNY